MVHCIPGKLLKVYSLKNDWIDPNHQNIFFKVIALLAYTGLIVASVYFDCPHQKYIMSRSQHLNFTRNQSNTVAPGISCEPRPINRFFAVILIINALLILAHEVQRAVKYFKEYAKHLLYHVVDTLGYICVIFTALIIATGVDHTSPVYEWFYPISAVILIPNFTNTNM